MNIAHSLQVNFLAIGQALVLGCMGFYILKRGILGACCLRTISNLVIEITLPCFMFTNILDHFGDVRDEAWYIFPLFMLGIFGLGALLARLYLAADRGLKGAPEFTMMVTFNNAAFLPIILTGALLPHDMAGKIFVHIFLFTILYNPISFYVSERILSGKPGRFDIKTIFNAATVATIAAMALSMGGLRRMVPEVVFAPLKMVGEATIPLSMIIIGGIMMVHFSKRSDFPWGFVLKAGILKLAVLPLAVFAIIAIWKPSPEIRFFLMLEAMMPPGAILPLLATKYGGDYDLMGQGLFALTAMSLLTVPLLLALLGAAPG